MPWCLDLASDVRLLRNIRQQVAGRLDGSGLPDEVHPLYATLCIEEMARTSGWGPSLLAAPEDADIVRPQAAAAGYEQLGQTEAVALMGRLDTCLPPPDQLGVPMPEGYRECNRLQTRSHAPSSSGCPRS